MQNIILPYPKVVRGVAFRALGDGTIQKLSGGKWRNFVTKVSHEAARSCLDSWDCRTDLSLVGA